MVHFPNEAAVAEGKYHILREQMSAVSHHSVPELSAPEEFVYIRMCAVQYDTTGSAGKLFELLSRTAAGMFAVRAPFSMILDGTPEGISLYYGTTPSFDRLLTGLLTGILRSPEFTADPLQGNNGSLVYFLGKDLIDKKLPHGAYLKGIPSADKEASTVPLDTVISGMFGRRWQYTVFAQPCEPTDTLARFSAWMNEYLLYQGAAECIVNNVHNALTYTQTNPKAKQYMETAEAFCDQLKRAVAEGEWLVTASYCASDSESAGALGGLLVSALHGDKSLPEAMHCILPNHFTPASGTAVNSYAESGGFTSPITFPVYSTFLTSSELGVLCCPPSRDTSGFAVSDQVEFDISRTCSGNVQIGRIQSGLRSTPNKYSIDSSEFNRHCLVAGLTGSGKTNTVKSMLFGISTSGRTLPFMIIEPAKREYYQMYSMGFEDLQLYSVGASKGKGFTYCLNPFERVGEVSLQTHIDMVFSAFKASFIMYPPMPYVLEKSIYAIYEDCGWDIANDTNRHGVAIYPTIELLYHKIPEVVNSMGYDTKMRRDLTASLQARINSMRLGSKGQALNVSCSFPIEEILDGHVVIELEDIGDDDVKSFFISLLLVQLAEHRRGCPEMHHGLCHTLVIEEAHRLLKNVSSGTGENADPRGAAVEFFCNMLAEMRSKGQGFIIVDQIPSKLAPDIIKNTNIKIAHRLSDAEERELIGGAMHMTEPQIGAITSFRQGTAAVYSENDYRPKLIRPEYAGKLHLSGDPQAVRPRTRAQVLSMVSNRFSAEAQEYTCLTGRDLFCTKCLSVCSGKYRDMCSGLLEDGSFVQLAKQHDPHVTRLLVVSDVRKLVRDFIQSKMKDDMPTEPELFFISNCLTRYLLELWSLSAENHNKFVSEYFRRLHEHK